MAQLRCCGSDGLKVVFAGPSVFGLDVDWDGIDLRRPAQHGDVEQAVADGACAIGLIDGHYQQVGAVWHKEILLALSAGVHVFGSSSMGALRAAECAAFGMVPVGDIARRYCNGQLFDDADVALVNGPAELGFIPLTEPIVAVEATVKVLLGLAIATTDEALAIVEAARAVFFVDRTIAGIFARVSIGLRAAALERAYIKNRVDPKAKDAIDLVTAIRQVRRRRSTENSWRLAYSPFWETRTIRSDAMTVV